MTGKVRSRKGGVIKATNKCSRWVRSQGRGVSAMVVVWFGVVKSGRVS